MPPSASRLPPLPRSVLQEVEDCESFARKSLAECKGEGEYPLSYNFTKAQRVVKTCAVEAFDIQAEHYLNLDGCCEYWMELIEFNTRQALNSLALASGFPEEYKEMLDSELRQEALKDKLDEWKAKVRALKSTQSTVPLAIEPKEEDRSKLPTTDDLMVEDRDKNVGTEVAVERRTELLLEYKTATGNPSNRSIYSARNSGIHKPQFYEWLKGDLPATSETCINFERFLREKNPPIPRKPRS